MTRKKSAYTVRTFKMKPKITVRIPFLSRLENISPVNFCHSANPADRLARSAPANSYILIYANRILTRYRFMRSTWTCQRVHRLVLSRSFFTQAGVPGPVPTRCAYRRLRDARRAYLRRSGRKRATLMKPVTKKATRRASLLRVHRPLKIDNLFGEWRGSPVSRTISP